jgi:hypothetical protein
MMFEKLIERGFEIITLHHAEAILSHDMIEEIGQLEELLSNLIIPAKNLIASGGGESETTQELRKKLSNRYGWEKHKFEIRKIVDGEEKESISHEIDHVKKTINGTIALEIEWNNKDPFFDRDLENFKRLHADGVISVGTIITRGKTLQESMVDIIEKFAIKNNINKLSKLNKWYEPTTRQKKNIDKAINSRGSFEKGWSHAFVSDKYGQATTHWKKLEDRVKRGVGNPCPLLLIGIPKEIIEI